MATITTDSSSYEAIAGAIRGKLGVATRYKPREMAAAVASIPTESGAVLVPKTISANGEYDPADDQADGYSAVTVAVPTPQPQLQSKTATENGTVTPDSGYDGLSSVVVNVQGGGSEYDAYVDDFTPDRNANVARSAGWKFTTKFPTKIVGIRFFPRSAAASVFLSNASGSNLIAKENVTVVPEQWNDIMLDEPVTIAKNTQCVVWGSNSDATMKWMRGAIDPSIVSFDETLYSTSFSSFPTVSESNAVYGVALIVRVSGSFTHVSAFVSSEVPVSQSTATGVINS